MCGLDVWWVGQYARADSNYYRAHVASALKDQGVSRRRRDDTREGLYDWNKDKGFKDGWCKRNAKACKAVKACVGAAIASISKDLATNSAQTDPAKIKSNTDMAIDAGSLCAVAAAAVYLT